jgi:hypothetical protein
MAFYEDVKARTYISGAAIAQFDFVVGPASDGQIDPAGAGARAIGVALQPATGAGQAIAVAYDGRVTVVAAGNITRGGNVASNASGKAVAATTGNIILGTALEDAVSGQVFTIDLRRDGTAA